jgi:chemotaxis-related protein WspD
MDKRGKEEAMVHDAHEENGNAVLIDDCWNRIGTRGDKSCPRLAKYMRCVGCPVFEDAAATLLERTSGDVGEDVGRAQPPSIAKADPAATEAAFVFRVAHEWLALPAAAIDEIGQVRAIHSLPHRRDPIVLGVVNVRGTLTIAASLIAMLKLVRASATKDTSRESRARLLVAAHQGGAAAFPVDEAEGIVRFRASDLMPVPSTLAHAALSHARGVLAWRDTTVGVLDVDRLFATLARSLR